MQRDMLVTSLSDLQRLYMRVDETGAVSAVAATDQQFSRWVNDLLPEASPITSWCLEARLAIVGALQNAYGYRWSLVEPETAASDPRVQRALSLPMR